jgi:hypothetical protein
MISLLSVDRASPINRRWGPNGGASLLSASIALPSYSGSTATWTDATRNGNNYSLTNVTWPNVSRSGGYRSAYFNGSNAEASAGTFFNGWTTFSIAFWVNFANGQSQYARIFEKGVNEITISLNQNSANNSIDFSVDNNGHIETASIGGVWHHVVCTFGSYLNLYVDGLLYASALVTFGLPATTGVPRLGRYGGGGYYGQFYLDDFRMYYNRALSATEVAALYTDSTRGYPNGLNRRPQQFAEVSGAVVPFSGDDLAHTPQYQSIMAM